MPPDSDWERCASTRMPRTKIRDQNRGRVRVDEMCHVGYYVMLLRFSFSALFFSCNLTLFSLDPNLHASRRVYTYNASALLFKYVITYLHRQHPLECSTEDSTFPYLPIQAGLRKYNAGNAVQTAADVIHVSRPPAQLQTGSYHTK